MESMKAVGRTGAVALLYFEIVSTIALIIGLIIVNVVQPGAGMNVDPATLDAKSGSGLRRSGERPGHCRLHYGCHPGERHWRICQR
ncbi:cation:dicarboxylate symporter family transporter [Escherichia coli]